MPIDYSHMLTVADSTVVTNSEFYKQGVTMPDRTFALKERPYGMGSDLLVVGAMAVMFCALAFFYNKGHERIMARIREFFSIDRQYGEGPAGSRIKEEATLVALTMCAALCLSIVFFREFVDPSAFFFMPESFYLHVGAGAAVLLGLVYAKALLYSVVNWVFFDPESNSRWMVGYRYCTALMAFVFYPVALLSLFCPYARQIVTFITIFAVFLYKLLLFYKLFANFKVRKYGYLLFISYLCTVELLPALLLGYFLTGFYGNVIAKFE